LNRLAFDDVFHVSKQQFTSIFDTANTDLSSCRYESGKVITWHGMSYQIIFPEATADYFNRVRAMDQDVDSSYRHF
jgi:feruloyl esterase